MHQSKSQQKDVAAAMRTILRHSFVFSKYYALQPSTENRSMEFLLKRTSS